MGLISAIVTNSKYYLFYKVNVLCYNNIKFQTGTIMQCGGFLIFRLYIFIGMNGATCAKLSHNEGVAIGMTKFYYEIFKVLYDDNYYGFTLWI